ncbi:hypothetical protein [Streptomyces inhibens]|uniref:hypothetical protein n=1 Tax=Streptomyces inhibens TaxID=2293571 RepID=UPI0015F29642|nr:hypothetical protein [Streptomyces inhibens]
MSLTDRLPEKRLTQAGTAATAGELRFCVHRLCEAPREAPRDALRVAESRSGRVT